MEKVRVRIYGQEYVISGEQSREHIMKVAGYVDSKMREIERVAKGGQTSILAVLSAVNVADEYFNTLERIEELNKSKEKLEKDVEHYIQMWEEAKKSFLQYKEDAQAVSLKKETLKNSLSEKEQEVDELRTKLAEAEVKAQKELETEMKKALDRLKEVEGNYFDLQMENVQLKSELERLRRA